MHVADHVRPAQAEDLVAALQLCSAEVVGGQVEALDVGPERAVEHDHAFGHRIEVGLPFHRRTTLPATPSSIWGSSVSPAPLGKIRVRVCHESSPDHDRRGRLGSMSTKTDSLAAGRGPLTRVSRDLSWFDPAPSWRRAADLVVGVARSAPSGAAAIGVPVGEKGAVPRQLGVDRATLTALGFEGKAGQTLLVPRRDGADVVAIGTGAGQLSSPTLRDAAAAFARAVPKHAVLATSLHEAGGDVAAAAQAVVEGVVLARYRFESLKSNGERSQLQSLTLLSPAERQRAVEVGIARGRIDVARRTARPRPRQLAAQSPHGDALGRAGHRGRQGDRTRRRGVRRRPPRRARVRRAARRQRRQHGAAVHDQADLPAEAVGEGGAHLALVGKGIMYDSGGISLKPSDPMHAAMKMDMSGAAAVLASMSALARSAAATR